jgi:hypothetical protein
MTKAVNETYLGDGVYASWDGFSIWLRAPRSNGDHYVALEPEIFTALLKFRNYPRGKLSDDDEGEADLAITVRDRTVVIAFAKPMRWIAMDKRTALAIARTLVERANEIK